MRVRGWGGERGERELGVVPLLKDGGSHRHLYKVLENLERIVSHFTNCRGEEKEEGAAGEGEEEGAAGEGEKEGYHSAAAERQCLKAAGYTHQWQPLRLRGCPAAQTVR